MHFQYDGVGRRGGGRDLLIKISLPRKDSPLEVFPYTLNDGRLTSRCIDTLSGEATLSYSVFLPFSIEINSLRKEFAPPGANSFLLRVDSSMWGLRRPRKQTGLTKFSSCVEMV